MKLDLDTLDEELRAAVLDIAAIARKAGGRARGGARRERSAGGRAARIRCGRSSRGRPFWGEGEGEGGAGGLRGDAGEPGCAALRPAASRLRAANSRSGHKEEAKAGRCQGGIATTRREWPLRAQRNSSRRSAPRRVSQGRMPQCEFSHPHGAWKYGIICPKATNRVVLLVQGT